MDMNNVNLSGRIGGEIDLRYTSTGRAVANFRIACNRTYGTGEGQKKRVTWARVVVWGKKAENVKQYCRKGSHVSISGTLETNSWTDSESGQKRSMLEINANEVNFLDRRVQPQQEEDQQLSLPVEDEGPVDVKDAVF